MPVSALYTGRARLDLIRDIAMGEWSFEELARQIGPGLVANDIQLFAEEFETEIIEVKAALAGKLAIETAGLWIAKKQNRIAELQADVEDINRLIQAMRDEESPALGIGSRRHLNLVRMKLFALRAVADETTVREHDEKEDGSVVHYIIESDEVAHLS